MQKIKELCKIDDPIPIAFTVEVVLWGSLRPGVPFYDRPPELNSQSALRILQRSKSFRWFHGRPMSVMRGGGKHFWRYHMLLRCKHGRSGFDSIIQSERNGVWVMARKLPISLRILTKLWRGICMVCTM